LSDLTNIAKSSFRGSLFLFLGQLSSTIFMAFASVLIAIFLGPEEYGVYTIVFVAPSLLIAISDMGVSPALTRFSAYYHIKGEDRKITNLIKTGILFKLAFSIIISLSMVLLAEEVATKVLGRPGIGSLICITSLYLIGQAVLDSINSIFVGLDKTEIRSLLENIQAVVKAVVSPLLIILGLGVAGAILGAGLGFLLAASIGISILLLRTCPALERNSSRSESVNFFQGLKKMLSYGMPIYFSALIGTVIVQYPILLLTFFTSNREIGNYAIVMNFSVLMNILTYPITASLFPAFSKLDIAKHRNKIEKMFKFAVKYASLIITPASLSLAVLSRDVVYMLFGSQYETAPSYLTLYTLSFLCVGLGLLVIGALIDGQGYTKTSLKITIVNLGISVPLALLLTPLYGVLGLIVSIIISQLIATSYGLYKIHQMFKLSIEPSYSLKILVASLLSALLVCVFRRFIALTNPLYNLTIGGILFIISFLVFVPTFGAISDEDIENLEYVTNELPIIRTLAVYILKIERRILRLKFLWHK